MLKNIKNKIIETIDKLISFFRDNLAQIIFLVFLLELLFAAKSLPYLNIINNYEFYVVALILFLSMIVFRIIIPYKRIVQIILVLFGFAFFFSLLEQDIVNNLIGFIAFIMLNLIVGRQVIRERKELKRVSD